MRSLHNIWAVFKQEVRLYFLSPIVYLIGGGWLALTGFFFAVSLWDFNTGYGEPTVGPMLSPMAFLMIFVAPALTMKLLADEVRSGTHELLLTAPVREWEIVTGKWLGSWAVITVFILITLLHTGLLLWRGNPDPGVIVTSYIGMWLLCGAMLAIGVFTSSLTQYQIVALMIGIAILIFLWLANIGGRLISNFLVGEVLNQVTLTTHYHSTMLRRGVIDPVDIAYFIGIILISLFLATQILGTRRWRA